MHCIFGERERVAIGMELDQALPAHTCSVYFQQIEHGDMRMCSKLLAGEEEVV